MNEVKLLHKSFLVPLNKATWWKMQNSCEEISPISFNFYGPSKPLLKLKVKANHAVCFWLSNICIFILKMQHNEQYEFYSGDNKEILFSTDTLN